MKSKECINKSSYIDPKEQYMCAHSFFAKRHPNSLWPVFLLSSCLKQLFCPRALTEKLNSLNSTRIHADKSFNILSFLETFRCENTYCMKTEMVSSPLTICPQFNLRSTHPSNVKILLIEDSLVQRKLITKRIQLIKENHPRSFDIKFDIFEVGKLELSTFFILPRFHFDY